MSQLTTLFDFLCQRLSNLGLRDLFVTLLCTENPSLVLSPEFFSTFVSGLSTPNAYFVITALHSVIKRSPYRIADYLQTPEIVNKLLDACLPGATYDAVVANECFQVLELLKADDLVSARASEFSVAARARDCSLASCSRVFPAGFTALIPLLFDSPSDTFLNSALIDAFAALPAEKKAEVAAEHDLVTRIVALPDANFVNGHITKLAELLKGVQAVQTDAWAAFVRDRLDPRVADRDRAFVESAQGSDASDGGNPEADVAAPSNDMSSSSDEANRLSSDDEDGIARPLGEAAPRASFGEGFDDDGLLRVSYDEGDDDDGFRRGSLNDGPRASFGDDGDDDGVGDFLLPPSRRRDFDDDEDDGPPPPVAAPARRRVISDDEEDEPPPIPIVEEAEPSVLDVEPPIPDVEPPIPDLETVQQGRSADPKEDADPPNTAGDDGDQ
jgi:hypothetical protein